MTPFTESFWEGDEVINRVQIKTSEENRKDIFNLLNTHATHGLELTSSGEYFVEEFERAAEIYHAQTMHPGSGQGGFVQHHFRI